MSGNNNKNTTSSTTPSQQQAPTSQDPSNKASQDESPSSAVKKTQLDEDDEFEDFPVEDWPETETSLPEGNAHLWEESWDDDDTTEDFAQILKEELKKAGGSG